MTQQTDRPRLFVSHHSSKIEVAYHVEKILAANGVDCWIAPRDVDPGAAFDSAIYEAINKSAAVLLLFCSQSDRSQHVKRELILADSAHKAIIPLRIEDVVPHDLAYHLASAQWIDWLEKRDDAISRIAAKARQLAGVDAAPGLSAAPAAAAGSAALTDRLHGELAGIRTAPADDAMPPPMPVPAAAPPARTFPTALVAIVGLLLVVAVLGTVLLTRDGKADNDGASGLATSEAASGELAAGTTAPDSQAAGPTPAPAAAASPAATAPAAAPAPPIATAAAAPAVAPPVAPPEAAPRPQRARLAPSFDCGKAAARAELLICQDDELSALDREMARAYTQLNRIAQNRAALAADQRSWRIGVRDRCSDSACVQEAMRARIMVLDQYRAEVSSR